MYISHDIYMNTRVQELQSSGNAREQELRTQLNPRDHIPRFVVARWAETLPSHITLCGSYRRECKLLGDIDILVPIDHFESTIAELKIIPYTHGTTRCSGFIKVGRAYVQIDVCAYRPGEYAYMLLYFTGSREFNIRMRAIAKKKGYLLSNTGMYKVATPKKVIAAVDERSIFVKLDMVYVRAKNRA